MQIVGKEPSIATREIKIVGKPQEAATSPREREDIVLATGQDIPPSEARRVVVGQSNANTVERVQNAVENPEMEDWQIAEQILSSNELRSDFLNNPTFIYEQASAVQNPYGIALEVRTMTNLAVANSMIDDLIANEDAGTWWDFGDRALDFLAEVARQDFSPVGISEILGSEIVDTSERLMYAASTMAPAEFQEFVRGVMDEFKGQTLRDNNANAYDRLKRSVLAMGYDRSQFMDKLVATWGAADLASIGLSAGAKGATVIGRALMKNWLGSTTTVGKIAAHKGIDEALEYAGPILRSETPSPSVQDASVPTGLQLTPQPVQPPRGMYAWINANNQDWKDASEILRNASETALTKSEEIGALSKFRDAITKRLENTDFGYYIDEVIDYTRFEHPRMVATLSRASGKPFRPLANGAPSESVKRLADDVGGEVRLIDQADPAKGYVVEYSENLRFSENISADTMQELEALTYGARVARAQNTFNSKALGALLGTAGHIISLPVGASWSPFTRASARAMQRANRSISAADRASSTIAKRVLTPAIKKLDKLDLTDLQTFGDIFKKLRDGSLVSRRSHLTDEEFDEIYWRMTLKKPSKEVKEGWKQYSDLQDYAAVYKAWVETSRYIELGYKGVRTKSGMRTPGRLVKDLDSIPEGAVIWDDAAEVIITKDRIPHDAPVHAIAKPLSLGGEKRVTYIVNPHAVDNLHMDDTRGFNIGGTRGNEEAKVFVGAQGGDGIRVLISANTEKQAKDAIQEIKNLQDAVRSGNLTEDVLQNNTRWAGSRFENVQEFRAFLDRDWKDFTEVEFLPKFRDEAFVYTGDANHADLFADTNVGDFVARDMSRNDRVLDHYGGRKTESKTPHEVLSKELESSLNMWTFRYANLQAATSWVKLAQRVFPQEFKAAGGATNDYITKLKNMDLKGRSGSEAALLRDQRNIILRRMGQKNQVQNILTNISKASNEFIFNTTRAIGGDKWAYAADIDLNAAVGKILGINHFLMFAFNPFQLDLQSSHAKNIMFIAPKHGSRGASMASIMSFVLDPHNPGVASAAALARLGDILGYSGKQMDEIRDAAWRWGADIIDGENMENMSGHTLGLKVGGMEAGQLAEAIKSASKAKDIAKAGFMLPYNFGERFSQMTAFYTAVSEFIAKNPGVAVNTPRALETIGGRAESLNFHMRRVHRSASQGGATAPAVQWLTYQISALEKVFIGREFTLAERARLAVALGPQYGLIGVGAPVAFAAKVQGQVEEATGSEFLGRAARSGFHDAIISKLFGSATSVSTRMSVVSGWLDLIRKVREDSIPELFLGPTGTIFSGGAKALKSMGSTLAFGVEHYNQTKARDDTTTLLSVLNGGLGGLILDDMVHIIRASAGINNILAGWGLAKSGVLTSRVGDSKMRGMEFGDMSGWLKILGYTLEEEATFYGMSELRWKESKDVQNAIKELAPQFERIALDLREGHRTFDIALIEKSQDQLKAFILKLEYELLGEGYTRNQIATIRRSVLAANEAGLGQLMEALIDLGFTEEARQLR